MHGLYKVLKLIELIESNEDLNFKYTEVIKAGSDSKLNYRSVSMKSSVMLRDRAYNIMLCRSGISLTHSKTLPSAH